MIKQEEEAWLDDHGFELLYGNQWCKGEVTVRLLDANHAKAECWGWVATSPISALDALRKLEATIRRMIFEAGDALHLVKEVLK